MFFFCYEFTISLNVTRHEIGGKREKDEEKSMILFWSFVIAIAKHAANVS